MFVDNGELESGFAEGLHRICKTDVFGITDKRIYRSRADLHIQAFRTADSQHGVKRVEQIVRIFCRKIVEPQADVKSLLRLTNFLYAENTLHQNSQTKARTDFFHSKSFCHFRPYSKSQSRTTPFQGKIRLISYISIIPLQNIIVNSLQTFVCA